MTPDGRYLVVRGRLWRAANPDLDAAERQRLIALLMDARRLASKARRTGDDAMRAQSRAQVEAAKQALGERGPVWWHDGAPDHTRRMARNTPYSGWFSRHDPDTA